MNALNFKLLACVFCVFAFSFSMNAQVQTEKDAAKIQWIQQNPTDYQKMGGVYKGQEPNFSTVQEKKQFEEERANVRPAQQVVILPNVPSFPKYVKSGNPAQDESNYRAAKDAWIQSNQKLYKELTKSSGETRENTDNGIKTPN